MLDVNFELMFLRLETCSICRLVITLLGCIVKILLIPFKYIFGGGRSSAGHCKYQQSVQYRYLI